MSVRGKPGRAIVPAGGLGPRIRNNPEPPALLQQSFPGILAGPTLPDKQGDNTNEQEITA